MGSQEQTSKLRTCFEVAPSSRLGYGHSGPAGAKEDQFAMDKDLICGPFYS